MPPDGACPGLCGPCTYDVPARGPGLPIACMAHGFDPSPLSPPFLQSHPSFVAAAAPRQAPTVVAHGAALAVALPFLFAVTDAPIANFWPVVASWVCVAALLLVAALWPAGRAFWAGALVRGLVLAALVATGIGLVQYFAGDVGLSPWIYGSTPGQAIGNLRQRNQQATLMALGAWALLWWLQQRRARDGLGQDRFGRSPPALVAACGLGICTLAVGAAATASRTGALQWLLLPALLVLWYRLPGRAALGVALLGLATLALAAVALPELLWHVQGVRTEALFERFAGDVQACTSRGALWANMLTLIGERPWLGWGWGELGYSHYVTLFPGTRFCALLDNAHNLPLHLAAELGLPTVIVLVACVAAWCARARPWRERVPARQLAWGVLLMVGLHSLLEYPLWYGPFQLVCLVSVALLLVPAQATGPEGAAPGPGLVAGMAAVVAAVVVLAVCAVAAWDYHRISQLYKPAGERVAAHRQDPQASVRSSLLFGPQREFAVLTTLPLTPESASRVHALALRVLHYSPEPRVIERLIESAALLGRHDEVAFHTLRYRLAYPEEFERWRLPSPAAPAGLLPAPGS